MDWTQVWTIVGANIALAIVAIGTTITLFLWARSEANADRRNFQEIQRQDRKDFLQLVRNIENNINAIQKEMFDFHHKLEKQDAEFKTHLLHKNKNS